MRLSIFITFLLVTGTVSAQKVGINTNNPQEQLHLRSDSTRLAFRHDSKKSASGGFDFFTVVATPSVVFNAPSEPGGTPPIQWTDLLHSKLINSDDLRMIGPNQQFLPEYSSIRVEFSLPSSLPSNAIITDISVAGESKITSTIQGNMLLDFCLRTSSIGCPNSTQIFTNSNTDKTFITSLEHNLNPAMINSGQYFLNFFIWNQISGISKLEIDKLSLEIEYKTPATTLQNVSWSSGVNESTFKITNSADLKSKEYLSIDEGGTTQLKGLRITKNAGAGKVLTSNAEGKAYWAEVPDPNIQVIWLNKEDTAYYASGPVQIDNNAPNPALIFSKGDSRLNNGVNMIETDNRLLNVIIDADNNQINEQFNIYKDSTQILAQNPSVRFNLGGNDSWINTGGDFIIGSDMLPQSAVATYDTLMFFDEEKGAFRAGFVDNSDDWAPNKIGYGSIATGANTQASGELSVAMGGTTTATGNYSMATGGGTTASGDWSTAMGSATTASGSGSTAMGGGTTASGISSIAMGSQTIASGTRSIAMCSETIAEGYASSAMGDNSIARGFASTVIGMNNAAVIATAETLASPTTPLFIIGNGDDFFNRSNAMVVKKNGNIGLGNMNFPVHPIHHNNGAHLTSGGTWTNASDRRLKSNIEILPYGLKEVMKLSPAKYIIKSTGESSIGFIAQDLKEIIPDVVSGIEGDMSKGETLGISYGNLVAVLANAIQEQQAMIKEQQVMIQKQQEILNSHTSLISSLQNQIKASSSTEE